MIGNRGNGNAGEERIYRDVRQTPERPDGAAIVLNKLCKNFLDPVVPKLQEIVGPPARHSKSAPEEGEDLAPVT